MPDSNGFEPGAVDSKIVIVAPNASTLMGGEAILPVHYYARLFERGYDVELVAHERNRENLEDLFGKDRPNLHFVPDTPTFLAIFKVARKMPTSVETGLFGPVMKLLTERAQKKLLDTILSNDKQGLLFLPAPVSPLTPTSIYRRDTPVVIGPMNGGMTYPEGYEDFGSTLESLQKRFNPTIAYLANRVVRGKLNATELLAANQRTLDVMTHFTNAEIHELPENGVDLTIWHPSTSQASSSGPAAPEPEDDAPLKLVFIGRLVKLKAVSMSLQAIHDARARGASVTLTIVGTGPEQEHLQDLTKQLQLEDHVTFAGFLKQEECARLLRHSDGLLLNSLRECGGAVVLEAMATGLPVIASDWGGPRDYVTPECGILVHPVPRDSFVERTADAIQRLSEEPELRRQMGENGRRRVVELFDWERKIDQIVEVFDLALQKHDSLKPDSKSLAGSSRISD